MDNLQKAEMLRQLYEVFVKVQTQEDCKNLLDDLCTKKEIEQMAQRILAARLLRQGDTYMEIIEKTDISSATLSRVSKSIQNGKGYKKFI